MLLFVHTLPERYRLSTVEMALQTVPLGRLTKRELRKLLFQEWKARGASVPSGKTAGSISKGKRLLAAFYQAVVDARHNLGQ